MLEERIRDIVRHFKGQDSLRELFSLANFDYANNPLPYTDLPESLRSTVSQISVIATQGPSKVLSVQLAENRLDIPTCNAIFKNLRRNYQVLMVAVNYGQAWSLFYSPDTTGEPSHIRLGDPDYYEAAFDLFISFTELFEMEAEDREPSAFELEDIAEEVFSDEAVLRLGEELKEEAEDVDLLGLYMKDVYRTKPQSPDQIFSLLKWMQTQRDLITKATDEAEEQIIKTEVMDTRDNIIRSNQRLVIWVVKDFKSPFHDFLDLVQAGNFGLIKAIEKFRHELGYKFSTYARFWIMQSIHREIDNTANTIRQPVHVRETVRRYFIACRELECAFAREPSISEIAERMGETREQVEHIRLLVRNTTCLGLDDLYKNPEDNFLPPPTRNILRLDRKNRIKEMLERLTDQQRMVMTMYFGLEDGIGRTFECIGAIFGVSRQRIQQIHRDSLERLRHFAEYDIPDLRSLLEDDL